LGVGFSFSTGLATGYGGVAKLITVSN